MKKLWWTCLLLTACSSDPVSLGYKHEQYPTLEEEAVGMFYNAPIPEGCHQISLSMDEMKNDLEDVVEELRKKGAERGANYVNIESVHYVSKCSGAPDKFIHATYYLCQ